MKPVIGILALQGCIEPHEKHLRALGVEVRLVRDVRDLDGLQGLILPGGESTTMLKLARQFGLWDELRALSRRIPFLGVCAGAILMARKVEHPAQESLDVFDVAVERNAYGRQMESFQGEVSTESGGVRQAVFIRAPKFKSWGPSVSVSGHVGEEPAFLESEQHMITAFHPELTGDSWFHARFLERVGRSSI